MLEKQRHRLIEILEESGVSGRKFAQSIGLAPGSSGKLLRGESGLSQLVANSIELNYGYSARWVLKGEGEKRVQWKKKKDPMEDLVLIWFFPHSQPKKKPMKSLFMENILTDQLKQPVSFDKERDLYGLINQIDEGLSAAEFFWFVLTYSLRDSGDKANESNVLKKMFSKEKRDFSSKGLLKRSSFWMEKLEHFISET